MAPVAHITMLDQGALDVLRKGLHISKLSRREGQPEDAGAHGFLRSSDLYGLNIEQIVGVRIKRDRDGHLGMPHAVGIKLKAGEIPFASDQVLQ